jgi:hypothetical protein
MSGSSVLERGKKKSGNVEGDMGGDGYGLKSLVFSWYD